MGTTSSGNIFTRLESTLYDNLNGGNTISVNKALLPSVFTLEAFNSGQEVLNMTYNTGDLSDDDDLPGLIFWPIIIAYAVDFDYEFESETTGDETTTSHKAKISWDLGQAYSGQTFDGVTFTADRVLVGIKIDHPGQPGPTPNSGFPEPYALEARTTNIPTLTITDENYA